MLDTRWAHLKDVTGVGSDADAKGKQTVKLGSGTTKYRHVLLWVTAPPTDGSTVRDRRAQAARLAAAGQLACGQCLLPR